MILVLDIGNSRVKWAYGTGPHDLTGHGSVFHRTTGCAERLAAEWQARGDPEQVLGVNVGGATVAGAVEALCRTLWKREPTWLRSVAQACGVRNGYRVPEQLGVDRWVALIAARQCSADLVCLADCGTALTIDAMDASGRHLGGLIIPGVHRMAEAVIERSAVPMPGDPGAVDWLGSSTADALAGGAAHAAADLIDASCRRLGERLGVMPVLLLTGGDAGAVAPLLKSQFIEVPDLVLKGVARLAQAST